MTIHYTITSLGFSIDGDYFFKINNIRFKDGLHHNLALIIGGERKRNESHPRQSDGSRTGGKKNNQLPFPIMSFDVNLPAINHLEVTSDKNRLTRLFLTNYCRALSNAFKKTGHLLLSKINTLL